MEYPRNVRIQTPNGQETCSLCRLTTTDAHKLIDNCWWGNVSDPHPDDGWCWAKITQKFSYSLKFERLVLKSPAGEALGAVISRIDATSVVDISCGAVMMQYLAVAPDCRATFSGVRRFRGVGTVLVKSVIRTSYQLGLGGRVNGFPLESAKAFHSKLGFEETDKRNSEGAVLFEIPATKAQSLIGVSP